MEAPDTTSTNGRGVDPTPSSSMRNRMTKHRLIMLKIQEDTRHGLSQRHEVPDTLLGQDYAESTDGSPEGWVQSQASLMRTTLAQRTLHEWGTTLLPFYRWMQTYQFKTNLLADIMAGLTVGVMVIPQSMSYAKLAGLPVEYGLYSALVPIYAYALWGSSRQLAVGPVALVSLILNTGLISAMERQGYTPESTANYTDLYVTAALQTSFLVGVILFAMGLLQLGFVTIFLSHAVVSGFTSGAAIVIGLSQVKYLFGYSIPNDKEVQKVLQRLFEKIDEFNWKTFVLGTSCVGILWGIKQLGAKYPKFKWTRAIGPLSVTTVGIILQATIDLEDRGIPIVGHIPSGLPHFKANVIFPLADLGNLWFVVFSIVIIGFMESIAIAKQLASKHHYELDSSLELFGLGMANICSGFFGGYPVVGSFSRSAVNNDSGAKSQISGMVTATLVALVLLFMTPVFELMPMAILASIVISGVTSLIDYPEAMYLWNVHKLDFTVWMLAFLGTLFLGAELGLSISVCISLLLVIFESAYPGTSVLGRLPGTQTYRSIKQYPQAERYDGIVMVRVDAPIYFANQQTVREKLKKYYDRAVYNQDGSTTATPTVHYVLLEMSAVSHVDTSALHMLSEFHSNYQKLTTPCQLCLVNPNPGVMSRLVASGVVEDVGKKHIFVSLHDAVEHCLYEMDQSELGKLDATIEATSTIGSVVPEDPAPSESLQPVGEHDVEDPPTKSHSA